MNNLLPIGTPGAVNTAAQSSAPHNITPNSGAMEFNGSTPLVLLMPASVKLLEYARILADQQHYQFAVVFAHAACELQIESVLNQLLNARADQALAKLVAPAARDVMSLENDRIYRVYTALTGDYPKGDPERKIAPAAWWGQWKASRQDRHEVAHRGTAMTPQQASTAIDAADKHMKHVAIAIEKAITS